LDDLNPNPQTYRIGVPPPAAPRFEPTPGAPVFFSRPSHAHMHTPAQGGRTGTITGAPAPKPPHTSGTHAAAVTAGRNTPSLGGTLATIQGYVSVSNYSYAARVTLILDNSGNNQLGPLSTTLGIYDTELDYYEYLQGFGTGGVYWSLGEGSTVDIRGGAADATFSLLGTPLRPSISIVGGGGGNPLAHSGNPLGVCGNFQTRQCPGAGPAAHR